MDRISPLEEGNGRDPNSSGILRNIGLVVLFFGAVFAVSAMETGSYRTPWPVAILVILAGIVLLGYARLQQGQPR